MARTFYCRYDDCGKPDEVVAGKSKPRCPACGRSAMWSTEQDQTVKSMNGRTRARVAFDLTHQDRHLFLKRVGIAGE